jgi:hypothetical protein
MMLTGFRPQIANEDADPPETRTELARRVEIASSSLGEDRKRRRTLPIDAVEILPPPIANTTLNRADWLLGQKQIYVYRLTRIAQRAGDKAKLWESLASFEPADRHRLWTDILGRGSHLTIRGCVCGFEALERWSRYDRKPSPIIYPATIETLIQYVLDAERKAVAKKKICPVTLPAAIRHSVVLIFTRLKIAPLPNFDGPGWIATAARIRSLAPEKGEEDQPWPIPPELMIELEYMVIHGEIIEALMAGMFLWMILVLVATH